MNPAKQFWILVCACLLTGRAAADPGEADLLSPNLRLAAMGNPYLVVEDWDREINAYDFGQMPAGIVADNQSKSWANTAAFCGLRPFHSTWMCDEKWDGCGICAGGAFHLGPRTAIGGRLSRTNHDLTYKEQYGDLRVWRDEYSNRSDSLVAGVRANQWLTLGLRGIYADTRYKVTSGYRRTEELWSAEPSILVSPASTKIQYGLHYRLYGYGLNGQTAIAHWITLPCIYADRDIDAGIKVIAGTVSSRPTYPYFPVDPLLTLGLTASVRRRVTIGNSSLRIAFHTAANDFTASMLFSKDRPYWVLDFGLGLAYTEGRLMTVGIQYLPSIGEGFDYQHDARREQSVNLGAEFYPKNTLPIRLGLARLAAQNGASHYFIEEMTDRDFMACDAVTAGFGVRWPRHCLQFDFAYNLLFYDYEYDDTTVNHLFGLSSRIVF